MENRDIRGLTRKCSISIRNTSNLLDSFCRWIRFLQRQGQKSSQIDRKSTAFFKVVLLVLREKGILTPYPMVIRYHLPDRVYHCISEPASCRSSRLIRWDYRSAAACRIDLGRRYICQAGKAEQIQTITIVQNKISMGEEYHPAPRRIAQTITQIWICGYISYRQPASSVLHRSAHAQTGHGLPYLPLLLACGRLHQFPMQLAFTQLLINLTYHSFIDMSRFRGGRYKRGVSKEAPRL